MSDVQRYAAYYLPDDAALAAFGAAWLGWDVERGVPVSPLDVNQIDLAAVTATPRKYGFHGTLKAPFRLAEGCTEDDLFDACATLAATQPPVQLSGLKVAALGHFLALIPDGDTTDLAALAARCVTQLDPLRAPLTEADLARRRKSPLTPRQDENLVAWGYPYIFEDFRFHLTLSGRLDPEALDAVKEVAEAHLPELPRPYTIRSISIVGEGSDGMFRKLKRFALTG